MFNDLAIFQAYPASTCNANASAPNVVVYPAQPSKGHATFQDIGSHSYDIDEKDCFLMSARPHAVGAGSFLHAFGVDAVDRRVFFAWRASLLD